MKLSAWILERGVIGLELPDAAGEDPTRLAVYACLISLNGGRAEVSGWGVHQGGGLYGTLGLSTEQALALITIHSFVQGMLLATEFEEQAWLVMSIKNEWDRVKALGA